MIQTAQYSFYEVRYWIRVTFSSLGMILKRQVSSNDIAGPVRIVSMIGTTVKESQSYGLMIVFVNLANMCILLSANLGVMNLLPIPALDGGRIFFLLLNGVLFALFRKKIPADGLYLSFWRCCAASRLIRKKKAWSIWRAWRR